MKKILPLISLVITFILIPGTAFAASAKVVSGPNGQLVNGWYSEPPTMVVDSIPSCPTGPATISLYGGGSDGRHQITLINRIVESYQGAGPKVMVADKIIPGDLGYEAEAWTCTALGLMGGFTERETIWSGEVKWDRTAPKISISSPSNNSNIDSSAVQINGAVSDNASGVWKVIIGGVNASISGGGFSASVPVNNGLNTLTATVYDYAGHTAQTQVIVNRISSCGGTCSASAGSTTNTSIPTANSATGNTQQQANNGTAENATTDNTPKSDVKNEDTPTLVKGVVQGGGIGLATILAFIVILLLLDKFRIIEIKAFSKITNKITKNKTEPKKPKKKTN